MSDVYDLDAAVATTAGEPFKFTWGGKEFTLPPILERDITEQLEIVEAIDSFDGANTNPAALLKVIQLAVGEDALEQMRRARPIGAAALMQLLRQWIAHQGGDLGKSSASPASSASTVRPLKSTSRSGRVRKTS